MLKRVRLGWILLYVILIFGSLVMVYPLVFAFAGSLCDLEAFYKSPWFPVPYNLSENFYLENYHLLFNPEFLSDVQIPLWVVNTAVRMIWYSVIPATTSVLAGYVLARLEFRGREAVFTYFLSSLTIPGIVFFIPTYVMMARWPGVGGNNWQGQGGHGFVNTWGALLITGWVNAFYIFLLRQTFYSIPRDFEESARIDGAGTLEILWHVYLPMIRPTLAVVAIFQSVRIWNDYQWPLIVSAGNRDIWTISLGFQRMLLSGAEHKGYPVSSGIVDYTLSFTMAVVATLPMLLLFLWLQDYFVEGVRGFSIKG